MNKIMARQDKLITWGSVSICQPTRGSGKAEWWERERDRAYTIYMFFHSQEQLVPST